MLTTILKSFDTIVNIASTSNSILLSLAGMGLIFMPISTDRACGISIGNKVMYEIVTQKYNEDKKQFEKGQQIIEPFDKLDWKNLQNNLYDVS